MSIIKRRIFKITTYILFSLTFIMGLQILQYPVFIVLILPIVASYYWRSCSKRVDVKFKPITRPVAIGCVDTMVVTIKNKSKKFCPFLSFEIVADNGIVSFLNNKHCVSLLGGQEISYEMPVTLIHRGVGKVAISNVNVGDNFGLFKRSLKIYASVEYMVIPQYDESLSPKEINSNYNECSSLLNKGIDDHFSVRDYKEYTDGEEVRFVSWKMLAKTDKMYIKCFEKFGAPAVTVIVDTQPIIDMQKLSIEDKLCSAAASIITNSINAKIPCTVFSGDKINTFYSHHDVFEYFALMPFDRKLEIDFLGNQISNNVYLITNKADSINNLYESLIQMGKSVNILKVG